MAKYSNFDKKVISSTCTYTGKYMCSYYDVFYGSNNRGGITAGIVIKSVKKNKV